MPFDASRSRSVTRPMPKSVSTALGCPDAVVSISTFDGFTSLCRTPTECAAASAVAT